MPTSSATPTTGGSTFSHNPRQSNGTRSARATGASAFAATALGAVGVRAGCSMPLALSGTGVVSSGEWKTAETMASLLVQGAGAARTLNESAYLAGSLPSHTTPSI